MMMHWRFSAWVINNHQGSWPCSVSLHLMLYLCSGCHCLFNGMSEICLSQQGKTFWRMSQAYIVNPSCDKLVCLIFLKSAGCPTLISQMLIKKQPIFRRLLVFWTLQPSSKCSWGWGFPWGMVIKRIAGWTPSSPRLGAVYQSPTINALRFLNWCFAVIVWCWLRMCEWVKEEHHR